MGGEPGRPTFLPASPVAFQLYDLDRDGKISQQEMLQVRRTAQMCRAHGGGGEFGWRLGCCVGKGSGWGWSVGHGAGNSWV